MQGRAEPHAEGEGSSACSTTLSGLCPVHWKSGSVAMKCCMGDRAALRTSGPHLDIVHKGIVADADGAPLHALGVADRQHVLLSHLRTVMPLVSRDVPDTWRARLAARQPTKAHLGLDGLLELAGVHLAALRVHHDGHREPVFERGQSSFILLLVSSSQPVRYPSVSCALSQEHKQH